MKAFITGVTGFAGTHLAEHLLACGDEVMGASRSARWPADGPPDLCQQVELVRFPLEEPPSDKTLGAIHAFGPDCIYHLAALSVPADCGAAEPNERAWAVNVGGVERIVELAARLASRPRFLLISSSYVYAPPQEHPRVSELSAVGPQQGYGITKLAAEQVVLKAVVRCRLDAVIVRAFQHTGPRQSPRMIVPEWSRQFARGDEPIRVHSLDTYLDLSDVRDVARAYRAIIERGRRGGIYNVGSGVRRRGRDIFTSLQRLAGSQHVAVESAPGTRRHVIADITRIKQECGWTPMIPFETTLADTLDFWRAQHAGQCAS